MDNFKKAAFDKLRIQTDRGPLSVEQVCELPIPELDNLCVSLDEKYNNSKGKSFINKDQTKDKNIKLQFDIVFEILNDKVKAADAETEAKAKKERNQRILAVIEGKKDSELEGKSLKQLTAMLED